MDDKLAVKTLSALAQPTRFQVFRLLMRVGETGMRAGDIAARLEVPQNTLSGHLAILVNADLLTSKREGRELHYALNAEATRAFMTYLTDDCCEGRPELCGISYK